MRRSLCSSGLLPKKTYTSSKAASLLRHLSRDLLCSPCHYSTVLPSPSSVFLPQPPSSNEKQSTPRPPPLPPPTPPLSLLAYSPPPLSSLPPPSCHSAPRGRKQPSGAGPGSSRSRSSSRSWSMYSVVARRSVNAGLNRDHAIWREGGGGRRSTDPFPRTG